MRGLPDLPKSVLRTSILAAVALVLYALGVRFLLLPVLLVANVLWLPMPSIFRSWFSRIVLSIILLLSLLQVAATLQFLVLPRSGFMVIAIILALVQVAILWLVPKRSDKTERWFTKTDAFGLLVVLFFLLPFAPIFSGHRSVEQIAEIGSIQAIDATNHYAYVAESTQSQHYTYKPGSYYPRGFHIAVGFAQNTVFKRQSSLNWQGNATLFFAQYVLFAAMLGYVLYLLCMSWLEPYVAKKRLAGARALAAIALGLPLAIFFLLAFVPEGFLNYYYVCATTVCGLLFLGQLNSHMKKDEDATQLVDAARGTQWWLLGALLLLFGAISSWPLLLPPLVVTAALFVVPGRWRSLSFWRSFWDVRAIPLALAFVLQLVPLYFQLKYASVEGSQGLNAHGGLQAFHPFVLLAGMVLLVYMLYGKHVNEAGRRLLFHVFMPLAGFVAALIFVQFFALGEVRYYAIKISMLLEMLLLVLAVVALVHAYARSSWQGAKYALFMAGIPLVAMLLLVSTMPNPLKDDRDLFRSVSQQPKPPYFNEDVRAYTELGLEGKLNHFNSTLLHYDATKDLYVAHSQLTYWMNMMQYTPSTDMPALQCSGALYANLGFGTFTPPEQQAVITTIRRCAALAHQRGLTYYIVTDKASAPQLRHVFGDVAKVVY